eukprot:TRINITY_DN17793_c0_g1_i1.p2 TRINITY_DN17793_c0_g1~~TRINITY_DN17793_c0_g1_i1.p2  ORF type:complete len:340 (-),score=132.26 TRINITY_DN17793_c0_g1_i1:1445-2335(-)
MAEGQTGEEDKQRNDADSNSVEVEVESLIADGPGASLRIHVPESSTISFIRQRIAARCGGGNVGAHIRLVRRLSKVLFLSLKDEDVLGSRRHLLLLGVDLAGVSSAAVTAAAPPTATRATATTATTPEATTTTKATTAVSSYDGKKDDEEQQRRLEGTWAEAAGFLSAAMTLLEDPEIQEALMDLDSRNGGVLASWDPPWAAEGWDELDIAALADVSSEKLQNWAKSFAGMVQSLAAAAATTATTTAVTATATTTTTAATATATTTPPTTTNSTTNNNKPFSRVEKLPEVDEASLR